MNMTQTYREAALNAILAHRFGKEIETLAFQQANLAHMAYEELFNETTRRKMYELPKGWLPEDPTIYLYGLHGNNTIILNFNGKIARLYAPETSISMRRPFNTSMAVTITSGTPLYVAADEFNDRVKALVGERENASANASAALGQFRTYDKLVEAWPEVAAVLPKPKPRAMLPAIPVATLNEMFKLPVKEEQ